MLIFRICYTTQVSNMPDCNGREVRGRDAAAAAPAIKEEPLVQLTDGEVVNFRQLIQATKVSLSLVSGPNSGSSASRLNFRLTFWGGCQNAPLQKSTTKNAPLNFHTYWKTHRFKNAPTKYSLLNFRTYCRTHPLVFVPISIYKMLSLIHI